MPGVNKVKFSFRTHIFPENVEILLNLLISFILVLIVIFIKKKIVVIYFVKNLFILLYVIFAKANIYLCANGFLADMQNELCC